MGAIDTQKNGLRLSLSQFVMGSADELENCSSTSRASASGSSSPALSASRTEFQISRNSGEERVIRLAQAHVLASRWDGYCWLIRPAVVGVTARLSEELMP